MKEVKPLYFSSLLSLGLKKTREQSFTYFLLMFPLKSGYFSSALKATRRITQAEFDMFYHNIKVLSARN